MPVFPLLLDTDSYRPCDWDLTLDAEARGYWLDLFESHLPTLLRAALESGYTPAACEAVRETLFPRLAALRQDPLALGDRLDILALDRLRDGALRAAGIDDEFRAVKARENDDALERLPRRLARLGETPEGERAEAIIRGVFAGNLFDMGAPATAGAYLDGGAHDFDHFLARVKPRPWLVDHFDRVRFDGWTKAVVFVDNAGRDAILGVLPLARQLALKGAEVVLAANEAPALNDITAAEFEGCLGRAGALAGLRDDGRLRVVSSGSAEPLLDLSRVSAALCEEAVGADLVVFVGMGRALESNWTARFRAATWRLATIKDGAIARRRGGELYDCVCRVDPPAL